VSGTHRGVDIRCELLGLFAPTFDDLRIVRAGVVLGRLLCSTRQRLGVIDLRAQLLQALDLGDCRVNLSDRVFAVDRLFQVVDKPRLTMDQAAALIV
jgi:hypothetical protein